MEGFLGCDLQPVPIVIARHPRKTPDRIEREIDCIEFDVRQRVYQRCTPFARVHCSVLDHSRRNQLRPFWTTWDISKWRRIAIWSKRSGAIQPTLCKRGYPLQLYNKLY